MRVLLRFAFGFVAAAALTLLVLPWWAALPVGIAALIPGILLSRKRRGIGPILLGLSLGLLWTLGYQAAVESQALQPSDEPVPITGTALDYSVPTTYGVKVRAAITDGDRAAPAMVWLYTDELIAPGDRFSVNATLIDAGASGGYYRAEGVLLLAYGKKDPVLTPGDGIPLRSAPRWFAHRLEEVLYAAMPEDTADVAVALTTGNREGLTALFEAQLKSAGIYHALALSGMHLAALVGLVSALTRKRRLRALIGIPLCFAFALVTGASASVVRAAVMQSILLLAPVLRRESDAPTSLGAAALALTIQNPWCILGWGMQLSFVSTAGIVLLSERIFALLYGDRKRKRRWPKVLRRLWQGILSSLSVTAGALAGGTLLMMAYFGRISLISPLTNLLTGWAVSWCFRGSLLTALTGLISPGAARLLGWWISLFIRYVQRTAALLSSVPFASLNTRTVYGFVWVGMVYGILLVLALLPGRKRPVIPACCVAAGLVACLLFSMLEGRDFTLRVLDVGQGQCIVATCRGQTVVVDCGGSLDEAVGDLAAEALLDMGMTRVDALILTHYDSDHSAGVGELLARVPVTRILVPDIAPEQPERMLVTQAAANSGTDLIYLTENTRLSLGTGTVTVYPPVTEADQNCGLSVLFDVMEARVLITGDMDAAQERLLLRQQEIPQVDILLAGHHGSKTSTSEALLAAAAPRAVVISVGRNSYGHPSPETLARIAAVDARVYRTDQNGTVTIRKGA